jgi:ABC-type bacteriocin/lantibiotic exporters, contain an N-terminal double-glycine peptidase domain
VLFWGTQKILILDEATSNLDVLTEERIVDTVNKLVKQENITVVFVTHRMSAIKNADKIIKLTN